MMSRCAETMVNISIWLIEILMTGVIIMFIYLGTKADKNESSGLYLSAVIVLLFLLVFNCMLYCFYDDLKIAIAIVDAAADFFADTKRIIPLSFIQFFI